MSRPASKVVTRKDEPPDKRRRTEEAPAGDANLWGADDWDETDFTDDQFEKIDVLCSQALNEPSQDFAKPRGVTPLLKQKTVYPSSSSLKNSSKTISQGTVSSGTPKVQTNLSYPLHSDTKMKPTYPPLSLSKQKSYPQHKGAERIDLNQNVAPRPPPSSSNIKTFGRQSNAPGLGPRSASSNQPTKVQENSGDSARHELEKVKEENERMKKQMQSQKEEQYSKDGQIKMLRESLTSKEQELNKHRNDKSKEVEDKVQDYINREKAHLQKEHGLKQEVEKLKAALQFKDHEISEAQSNMKRLEQRVSSPNVPSPSQRSPRMGKRSLVDLKKSPETPKSAKLAFPNKRTFMATESISERSTPPPVLNIKKEVLNIKKDVVEGSPLATSSAKSSTDVKQEPKPVEKARIRKYALKVASRKGAVTGRHLMSRLVDHHDMGEKTEGDLVWLLNNTGSPPKARETVTPGSRTRLVSQTSVDAEREDHIQEARCCLLARTGMNSLLSHSCNSDTHSNILSSKTTGACDILPILETTIKHYLDYQSERKSNRNSASGSNSSKSFSYDGSLDSVSSAMRNLELGHNLSEKGKVDTALKILYKLVCYSKELRDLLLGGDGSSAIGVVGPPGDSKNLKDNEPKPSTSHACVGGGDADFVSHSQSTGLLSMLFKLATPVKSDEKPINLDTTQLTLKILTMLARLSSSKQVEQLLPLVTNTTFSKCLALTSEPTLVIKSMELLEAISTSMKIVSSFCNQTADSSTNCIFLDVYSICLQSNNSWTTLEHTAICEKVVNFLWTVVNHHKIGVMLLLESDCHCSVDVVKSLVLILNAEMVYYKEYQCAQSYQVITRGIRLLHIFYLQDQQFTDHWLDVELQYTSLVCSMSILHKQMGSPDETISMAIQDLWEIDEAFLNGEKDEPSMSQ